ncbi:ribosomal RNA large subunit methyltransferase J [Acrasis kona]|uniref:Ribosomal RNA large subunit methyltransferase J n=1 Tax=Acrasis kona TaxID=1008807 RepID=A0AAW2YYF0_9EUKA
MEQPNIQTNNVGNMGDIIKHSLLVQIMKKLIEYKPKTFVYVDLHTYLFHSKCDLVRFESETKKLSDIDDYISIEQSHLEETGFYLCSSGIATHFLREVEDSYCILSEQNPQTKVQLESQLSQYTRVPHYIMNHSTELPQRLRALPPSSTLFVLIDPFKLTLEDWSVQMATITECVKSSPDVKAVIEVFDYDEIDSDALWSKFSIDSVFKMIRSYQHKKYHLAVFATHNIADSISQAVKVKL